MWWVFPFIMDDKVSLLGDKGKRIFPEINAATINPVKLFDPVEATSADLTKVLVIGEYNEMNLKERHHHHTVSGSIF